MKNIKKILFAVIAAASLFFVSCSDIESEITSLTYDRLFSPTDFSAVVINKTNALISFTSVSDADSYVAEVYYRSDTAYASPYKTLSGITGSPDTITGLEGETQYTIRLKAVSSSNNDSKWVTDTITTGSEQILSAVNDSDLTSSSVVLRWEAGLNVTSVTLATDDGTVVTNHTLTSDEIAAGAVSLSELSASTTYTAKIYNGTKQRGTVSFTTLIDIGNAIAVYSTEDLATVLNSAQDGDSFVLIGGSYYLGDYTITKSISISGYKSSDKPIIYGKFLCGSTVSSLSFTNVILDGSQQTGDSSQRTSVFDAASGCNLGALTFTSCELRNYIRTLIYNNVSGTLGNVTYSDCIVHDFPGTGGDGFDIRTGTLTSLTVKNSTFYNGFRAFLRLQVSSSVTFSNCTMYEVCILEDSNNTGLFRSTVGGTLAVSNCLFVQIGSTTYGAWCKSSSYMKSTPSYSGNIYYNSANLWTGYYTSSSGVATEANPQFADPTNGDFTVGNALVTAGDPRWLSN